MDRLYEFRIVFASSGLSADDAFDRLLDLGLPINQVSQEVEVCEIDEEQEQKQLAEALVSNFNAAEA